MSKKITQTRVKKKITEFGEETKRGEKGEGEKQKDMRPTFGLHKEPVVLVCCSARSSHIFEYQFMSSCFVYLLLFFCSHLFLF